MLLNLVLFLVTLLLFTGLCLDVGAAQLLKLKLQHAADAGALSAALEGARGSGNWASAAQADAALNGFTNASNGVTVTANNPPSKGSFTADSSAYEVFACAVYKPAFLGIIGFTSETVCSRAVAHNNSGLLTSTIFGDPSSGSSFVDSVQTALANGQPLTSAVVHGGWVNDALQGANSAGSLTYHGGTGGNVYNPNWGSSDYIVRFYGVYLTGSSWYGNVIGQISFVTKSGVTYGPYGTAFGGGTVNNFDYTLPTGSKAYGFIGTSDSLVRSIGLVYGYSYTASLVE